MKLTTTTLHDEKYSSVAAVAPGGWCCHCHCSAAAFDGIDDGGEDPGGYEAY
jgi:streptolysin S family bacteriocin protoxin